MRTLGYATVQPFPALEPRHCNKLCRQGKLRGPPEPPRVPNLERVPGWSAQLFPALEPTHGTENDLVYIDLTSLVELLQLVNRGAYKANRVPYLGYAIAYLSKQIAYPS